MKNNKTTFDQFFIDHPEQKEKFSQEYNDFLLSELIIESMTKNKLSVRSLAKKSQVSPTVIQKLRGNKAESINFHTLRSVMTALGYQMHFTLKKA